MSLLRRRMMMQTGSGVAPAHPELERTKADEYVGFYSNWSIYKKNDGWCIACGMQAITSTTRCVITVAKTKESAAAYGRHLYWGTYDPTTTDFAEIEYNGETYYAGYGYIASGGVFADIYVDPTLYYYIGEDTVIEAGTALLDYYYGVI